MNDIAEPLNRNLRGFTDVVSFALTYDEDSSYSLRVELANENERIELLCRDISGLGFTKFGGGLTQLMFLHATDVRDQQLDRVALRFTELEGESIVFNCAAAEVKRI